MRPDETGDRNHKTARTGLFRIGPRGAPLAARPGGAVICRLRAGVLLPFSSAADGWARVLTPCEHEGWIRMGAGRRQRALVMLDPGHGGDELGAVGPGGMAEKDLNFDVARRSARMLRAHGVSPALTRTGDYRATLAFRAALAARTQAALLVSIHHNAAPDGPSQEPGTETYYQYRSPDSRRLAGLLYEEIAVALVGFETSWMANADAGAKWRLNDGGEDYYGILRRCGDLGVTAALVEPAFLSNPEEEVLLRRGPVRQAEAEATARAILAFLHSDGPGSGYTTPHPRSAPAGPGGGRKGCIDPS
ncbi:MAG: N-acetylmuramoyl-L-alanine amidase family protein [Actinomycetota bacterium]